MRYLIRYVSARAQLLEAWITSSSSMTALQTFKASNPSTYDVRVIDSRGEN